MDCVTVTTELVSSQKRHYNAYKKDYKLDFWRELRKRWMIIGVLVSMTLAVLSPKVGAPGGPLHTEYLSYLPLCCIYYSAGRRACGAGGAGVSAQRALLSAAHAHVAAPALLAASSAWLTDAIDYRVLKGALLSSIGGPCAWLSLVAARDVGDALTLLTVNYATSLVAAPITMFFVCGRAPIPALGPSVWSALCALPALTAGAVHAHCSARPGHSGHSSHSGHLSHSHRRAERVCSLALLYVDCCARTATAGAGLYVGDVLSTLLLAVWCVSGSALVCALYARAGLSPAHAHTLAICAVPKALHTGWESSIDCVPSGLSRLPAVFLAPAQALLLATVADYDDEDPSTDGNVHLPQ